MIHPEWGTIKRITTSRDSRSRPIHYYKDIDAEKMKAEFFRQVNELVKAAAKK